MKGQRQIVGSSRKARAPLPVAVLARGNARTATCIGAVQARDRDGHFQKVVLRFLNKRYLLMLVIFEGAYPSPLTKEKT